MRIYMDMDGTLLDLYGVGGWLEMLREEDATPYRVAPALVNPEQLCKAMRAMRAIGATFGIISWSAKDATPSYKKAIRREKIASLKKLGIYNLLDEIHVVAYGTPKRKVARVKGGYLVDDEPQAWAPDRLINAEVFREFIQQF